MMKTNLDLVYALNIISYTNAAIIFIIDDGVSCDKELSDSECVCVCRNRPQLQQPPETCHYSALYENQVTLLNNPNHCVRTETMGLQMKMVLPPSSNPTHSQSSNLKNADD